MAEQTLENDEMDGLATKRAFKTMLQHNRPPKNRRTGLGYETRKRLIASADDPHTEGRMRQRLRRKLRSRGDEPQTIESHWEDLQEIVCRHQGPMGRIFSDEIIQLARAMAIGAPPTNASETKPPCGDLDKIPQDKASRPTRKPRKQT